MLHHEAHPIAGREAERLPGLGIEHAKAVWPITHQPVGIGKVVIRHCPPAIITLPGGWPRTGASLRGSCSAVGTPPR
jgi:hypothetical protein